MTARRYQLVVRPEGVPGAIARLKREHQDERRRHPHVERYLQDHRPDEWDRVRHCRTRARVVPHLFKGTYKVRLYGCHTYPWCFACSREAKYGRANRALDRFSRCTPDGKPLRLAHIVQTAAITEAGIGWGNQALHRPEVFRRVIGRVLGEAYGAEYGAYVSLHAFGERAFAKWHPHLDLTLNGWMPGAEGPELTRTFDLKAGRRRWLGRTAEHAAAMFLIDPAQVHTNLNIQHFVTGASSYYGALLYQVRELVDVRKMEYDRARQLVYWRSYRDNTRQRMTVQEFHDGLAYYQSCVGQWGKYQAKTLHVGMGHLANHKLDETQEAMGGRPLRHKRNCPCAKCDYWGDPLFPDEESRYEFDPWQAPALEAQALAVPA